MTTEEAQLDPMGPLLELPHPELDLNEVEPWLQNEVASLLEAEEPIATAVAVAIYGRAWAPLDRKAALADLLAGRPVAQERARAWARALSDEERRHLSGALIHLVGEMREHLADEEEADASFFAIRREEVENLLWVLTVGGERALDPFLADEVEELDERIRRSVQFPRPTRRADQEMAWRHPEAWWWG